MKPSMDNYKKIKVEIKYFSNEEDDESKPAAHTDWVVFKDEGLTSLKEISDNPTNAIVMAIQLALKLKRFDPKSSEFKIETRNKKGNLDVPEWKE